MKKGFTLIELLVVVLILGILASVALPQYEKAVEKARVAEAVPMLKKLIDIEKQYRLATGSSWYTPDLEKLDFEFPSQAVNGPRTSSTWKTDTFSYEITETMGLLVARASPYKSRKYAVYMNMSPSGRTPIIWCGAWSSYGFNGTPFRWDPAREVPGICKTLTGNERGVFLEE